MNDKHLYYKNKYGEIQYNSSCESCPYDCKQSFRSTIVDCKMFKELRKKKKVKK